MGEAVTPCLIGIAGPSGSGKTAVARRVAAALGAPIVSLDSYYRDMTNLPLEERARTNFDDPASLDEALLAAQVGAIARGETVDVPEYDFSQHTRSGEFTRLTPAAHVIVEGLFALYWEQVRRLCRVKVFIETPEEVCFERRLRRDMAERGRTEESVRAQYEATVRPMGERYVLPTRRFADLVLDGTGSLEESVAAVVKLAIR